MRSRIIGKIEILRRNGEIFLKIKVCQEIEDFFRNDNIKESSNYLTNSDRLLYYHTDGYTTEKINKIREIEEKYHVFLRSYGAKLRGDRCNFSILRTKDISKKTITIKVDDLISKDALEDYVKQFKNFISNFYRDYFKRCVIKSSVEVVEYE